MLDRLEADYRRDPAERHAVAALTGSSRLVEEWRYARVELVLAEVAFTASIKDLEAVGLLDGVLGLDEADAP